MQLFPILIDTEMVTGSIAITQRINWWRHKRSSSYGGPTGLVFYYLGFSGSKYHASSEKINKLFLFFYLRTNKTVRQHFFEVVKEISPPVETIFLSCVIFSIHVFSIQCCLVLNFFYWMKIYILSSVWRRFASNESNSRTFRESLLILVWGCSQKDQAYVTIGSTPPSTVDSIILLELFFLAWWVFCPPRNPLIQDTHNWGPNFIFPTLIKYLFNDNFYYSSLD